VGSVPERFAFLPPSWLPSSHCSLSCGSTTPLPHAFSTAPISHRPPDGCGRASPRWSVASHAIPPLPAGAGLPVFSGRARRNERMRECRSAIVLQRPNHGVPPVMLPVGSPTMTQPFVLSTKLYPCDVRTPEQSGASPPCQCSLLSGYCEPRQRTPGRLAESGFSFAIPPPFPTPSPSASLHHCPSP